MGGAAFAKAGADATNSFITTFAKGRAERAQMKANQAENERLNKMTWNAMGNRINTVNLQRGLLRQQTGTDLYNIGKEANRAGSASLNNAAASGIEGASVNDAASDIQRQNQAAQAVTTRNEQIQEVNLDTSISDIIDSAVSQQRYSQKPTSTGEIFGRALGVSGMQFISSLAGSSFDYMPTSGSNWSQDGQSQNYDANAATAPSGVSSNNLSTDFSSNDRFTGVSEGYSSSGSGYAPSNSGTYNFNDFTSIFNGS